MSSKSRISWRLKKELKNIIKEEEKHEFTFVKKTGIGLTLFSIILTLAVSAFSLIYDISTRNLYFITLLIIIILFIGVFCVYYDYVNEKNNHLKDMLEIKGLDYINLSTRLREYQRREDYQKFFSRYVHFESNVISVQLYDFSLSNKQEDYIIRIQYDNGYVDQENDLNAIVQGIYKFNKKSLNELKKAVLILFHAGNIDFLLKYISEMSPAQVKENDQNFILFTLAIDYYLEFIGEKGKEEDYYGDDLKRDKRRKRIGLAKAILRNEIIKDSIDYYFKYSGSDDSKETRHYYTEISHTMYGQKKIFLIAYDVENGESSVAVGNRVAKEFRKLLSENDLVKEVF